MEQRYRLKFRGITPIVMNSNAGLLGPKEDKGPDKLQWEKDHMLDMVYKGQDGGPIIPSRAVKATLINGCRFVSDKPRGTSFKSFGPFIQGVLLVEEDAALNLTIDKIVPFIAVVNLDPSKGPRGPRGARCRPMVPLPWFAETTCMVLDPALSLEALTKIADAAGKKVGFLDGRTIDFGRCYVTVEVEK